MSNNFFALLFHAFNMKNIFGDRGVIIYHSFKHTPHSGLYHTNIGRVLTALYWNLMSPCSLSSPTNNFE